MDSAFLKTVFNNSPEGVACHRIILDENNRPCDSEFIYVNPAYELITSIPSKDFIGRLFSELFPDYKNVSCDVIGICGNVALNGGNSDVEFYAGNVGRWFHMKVYSPEPFYFTTLITDISEQKKKQETLEKNAHALDVFFDVSLDLLCIFDSEGRLIKHNSAWRDVLGYESSEIETFRYLKYVHPDDYESTTNILSEIKQKKELINYTNRCRRKDGSYCYLDWRLNLHGNFIYATAHDITEQILSDKKLRESEEKFRLMFENSPLGLIYFDANGVIKDCNELFVEIVGSSKEALVGLNMLSLPDKRITDVVSDTILQCKTSILEIVYSSYTADKITPVRLLFAPIRHSDGSTSGGIGIIEDITERLKAEEEIRTSMERYQALFEQAADGVLIGNNDGVITNANNSIIRISGYTKEELIGNNISMLFPDEVLEQKPLNYKSVHDGETVLSERELIRKNGDIVFIEMNTKKVADGRLQAYLRDVTEQRMLREKLKHSEKMEAIGQLAGGIAHDFNNMLAGIIGGASLLEKYVDTEKGERYLTLINDSARRTADLTNKLLAFGRKSDTDFQPENINTAINNAVDILHYTLDKKIDIHISLDPEVIMVQGSLTHLQNVFINLGINSGHAMPDGGRLSFSSGLLTREECACRYPVHEFVSEYYAMIEVEDTGTGIPADYKTKIFEPFFTTKQTSNGSGLGLATVYGTVKEHNGIIEFQSEEGKGTVFHIFLPVSGAGIDDWPSEDATVHYGSGSILLIEDEPIVRETSREMLEELGYRVVTAENGEEGVSRFIAERDTIDLVIVDMIMPKMNGKECFTEIRKIDPGAKVILATGFSNEDDIDELKKNGLTACIKKPFQMAELSLAISDCF